MPNMIGRPLSIAMRRSRARQARCASPPEMSGPIWKMPARVPPSPRPARRSHASRRCGCDRCIVGVTWVVATEVEKPIAPARIALADRMRHHPQIIYGRVSSSARLPIAYMRSAEWPIYMP